MKEYLEIERKWLVKGEVNFPKDIEINVLRITQFYLLSDRRERLRIINDTFGTSYIHTIKRPAEGGGNWEWERELSPTEFWGLTSKIDSNCQPLTKERWTFWWSGRKYELDKFIYPVSFQILEVELEDLKSSVVIPDFIGRVVEVTDVKGFSNKRIASNPSIAIKKAEALLGG